MGMLLRRPRKGSVSTRADVAPQTVKEQKEPTPQKATAKDKRKGKSGE